MAKEKMAQIYIPEDEGLEKGREQMRLLQIDGKTLQIPVNRIVEVPLKYAELAKKIGYIKDYKEL